jgi:ketosteroid isomerase-like protein
MDNPDALPAAGAPQRAIETIREAYDAYNRGDLDALVDFFAPDAEMEVPVLGQLHRGRAEIRRSFEDYFEVVEGAHTEPLEFIQQSDEVVVVPVRLHGRLRHTGITDAMIPTEMVHVFAVRNRSIVWNHICGDRDEATRAAERRIQLRH